MKKVYTLLLVGLLSTQVCFAAGNSRITLNDGTTIYGKVIGMSDGVYTIRTEAMGDINVNSDNVSEISSNTSSSNNRSSKIEIIDGNTKNTNNSNNSYNNNQDNSTNYIEQQKDANARVQSMMMDENFMENLMQLNNSSEMQSVLNDPEVMNAIQSGDYEFLMNNSKMNSLMNSSEIQDILGGM